MRIKALVAALALSIGLCAIHAQSPQSSTAYAEAISADVLISAFQENQIAANAKYAGHRMSVGGIVDKVGQDKAGNPFLILRPNNHHATGSMKCRLPASLAPRIAQLRRGAPVGVKGTVVSSGRSVVLDDCTL